MAPEMVQGLGFSFQADLWALGILIFTLFFGYNPFIEAEQGSWLWTLPKDRTCSRNADTLIERLLTVDPNQRIILEEVVDHPFFRSNKFPRLLPTSSIKSRPSENYISKFIPAVIKKTPPPLFNMRKFSYSTVINKAVE
jgi:serine/threonine-protein kinase GIN4